MYAEGCYEHCKYAECVCSCDKLLGLGTVEQNARYQIQVLRSKAIFKIYQSESRFLQNEYDTLSTRDFNERKTICYKKLHEVIGCLGAAVDRKSIDSEELACLDYAMIELVCGTNELSKCRRCMLCLQRRSDLKRSHIVPKSVLEVFRTGFVQHHGNKGLIVAGANLSSEQVYHSDKTITKFMLCGDCEMLLSKNGEQDFVTKFFKKIYDPHSPDALMEEQKLSYQCWLYHFCIGLLFRTIAGFVGIPNVMNHLEVYGFFVKCRKILLAKNYDSLELPRVYLLTNPARIPLGYENKWIREALVEPAFFDIPGIRLSNGNKCHFPEAHFLVAHLGILNMLVSFSPADDVSISDQFVVHPHGGVYVMPPEVQRLQFLPGGMKQVFSRISESIKEDMKWFLFSRKKPFPPVVEKTTDRALQDTVGLIDAINADFDLLMKSESKIDYLPSGFHIDAATKTLQLPPEYSLMVHVTTVVEVSASAFTYFIGLVDLEQPFVIIYQRSKVMTKCFGCLVSEDDLTVKRYIGNINPNVAQELDSITSALSAVLSILLPVKGFKNMRMLSDFFKHK